MPDTTTATDATDATNGEVPAATVALIAAALQGVKRVDQGKFKLGELEDLEDELGTPLSQYFNSSAPPIRFMRGLLWLRLRRDHPQLRFDDLRSIDLDTLEAAFGGGENEEPDSLDPTDAASTPDGTPDSSSSATSRGSATSGG